MKSKILMMSAVFAMLGSLIVAPSVQAHPSYYHGYGYHGHGGYWYGGRGFYGFGLGLAAGALLTYPYENYVYTDYYSPAYVERNSVTVYDNSPSQTVQTTPSSSALPIWYYCQSPKGYYPYVHECPSGWQKVPATPPH